MTQVAVIDYGMGNLHSAAKAVEHVGAALGGVDVIVTADAQAIANADRVIFPGVGAIRDCMAEINRLSVGDIVRDVIAEKPLMAICVGMQALMTHSEENGGVDCLGIIDGRVRFFSDTLADDAGKKLKVPHMGWNNVSQCRDHALWHGIDDGSRFYFVHSLYIEADAQNSVVGSSNYGHDFVASIVQKNLFAVQFHPEKSQPDGLTLLKNFMQWDGSE